MNTPRDVVREVLAGLTADVPHVSPKYFYDALGSTLFDAITQTDAYYPTDCEREILAGSAAEIAAELGPGIALVELGAGVCAKVPYLLDVLQDVALYAPVDIDGATIGKAAVRLRGRYPGLEVTPVVADFTHPWSLPELPHDVPVVVFYPGSTIGNFDPGHAEAFLTSLGAKLDPGDRLLLGVDLEKDVGVLEAAYDDPAGVTAAFNRNLLAHLNRLVGADFDPRAWAHVARYDADAHRIEMYLEAQGDQVVTVGDQTLRFVDGSRLHTENSYKFTRSRLAEMAVRAGWTEDRWWTDSRGWFGMGLYRWGG